MTWTEIDSTGRTELVLKVWQKQYSAARIAKEIGKLLNGEPPSRNAVIGHYRRNPELEKSHPLGGGRKRGGRSTSRTQKLSKIRQQRRAGVQIIPADAPKEPVRRYISEESQAYDEASFRVRLVELSSYDCRWVVNDPEKGEEHLFCGHPRRGGKPYCRHHCDRAFQRLTIDF